MDVVGEAASGREAVAMCRELNPDIAIVDIAMPEMNGVEATRQIRQDCSGANVIILSMHKDAMYVRETLRAGAKGYLLKDAMDKDIVQAIRAVARGEAFLSPGVSATVLDD